MSLFQDEIEHTAIERIRKFTKRQEELYRKVREVYDRMKGFSLQKENR